MGIFDSILDIGGDVLGYIFGGPQSGSGVINLFGPATSALSSSSGGTGSIFSNLFGKEGISAMAPLLPAALIAGASLFKPGDETPYSQSESYLNSLLAWEKEKYAQQAALQREIAALQASSAGAGIGARVAADLEIAKKNRALNLLALKEKVLSESIKNRMEAQAGRPEIELAARQGQAQAAQAQGQTGANAFADAARLLQGFRA